MYAQYQLPAQILYPVTIPGLNYNPPQFSFRNPISFMMTDNSEQWCRTTSGETTETKFTWKIEDFKNRPEKVGKDIQSSIFLSKNPDKKTSSWKLCLYPNGAKESENNHFSIFLESCNDFPVKAKYCVSILDASSKKTHAWDCSTDVYNAVVAGKSAWGNGQWALRESIINNPELLPGGHLTIVCELTVYGTEETLSGSKDVELKARPRLMLEDWNKSLSILENYSMTRSSLTWRLSVMEKSSIAIRLSCPPDQTSSGQCSKLT